MRPIVIHGSIFVLGILAGVCLSLLLGRQSHPAKGDIVLSDADTTEVCDTSRHGKEEVEQETIGEADTKYIYMYLPSQADTVWIHDTLYLYVEMQRQRYHASTDDVEVWYSGIDASIDSLQNIRRTQTIVNTYKAQVKKNLFSLYGEAGYSNGPSAVAGVKYLYYPRPWIGIGGKAERDFMMDVNEVMLTAEIDIRW